MPQAGKLKHYDDWILNWSLGFTANVDAGHGAVGQTSIQVSWAPNGILSLLGASIQIGASMDQTTHFITTEYDFQVPLLGINKQYTYPVVRTGAATMSFNSIDLYQLPGGSYLIIIGSVTLSISGTTLYTATGPFNINLGYISTPSSIPIFGGGAIVTEAQSSLAPQLAIGSLPVLGQVFNRFVQASGNGGYSFDGGQTLPVFFSLLPVPSAPSGCDCPAATLPVISATTTNNVFVDSSQSEVQTETYRGRFTCYCATNENTIQPRIVDLYDDILTQVITSSSLSPIPDLSRAVNRINNDYAALIFRGGLPQTTRLSSVICGHGIPNPDPSFSATNFDNPNAEYTSLLGTVTNSHHVIEDPLGERILCPYNISASKYVSKLTNSVGIQAQICGPAGSGTSPSNPPECGVFIDDVCQNLQSSGFPTTVESSFTNPYLLPSLDHIDPLMRYINYCVHPHWSYYYWFYPDVNSGALKSYEWPVYGTRHNPSLYWLPIGEQWIYHPALPNQDNHKTRNTLISAPLMRGGLTGFALQDVGQLTSWWGISRFKVQQPSFPASLQLDATSNLVWSFANCTGTFDSNGVTLTSTGPTSIVAEYQLGTFTSSPFLYPLIAQWIEVNWFTNNIDSVSVYLTSPWGGKKLLTTSMGKFPRPFGMENSYAGSWGQDLGAHGELVDTGTDTDLTNGKSSPSMGDPFFVYSLELLAGREAYKLRFEVKITDPTSTCQLKYPKFYAPTSKPTVIQENRLVADVMWPDGPSIRWGQHIWYDLLLLGTPEVALLGYKSSVIDWLCWKREAIQGVDRGSGLDAEIATLYDSIEGQTQAITDQFSMAFMIPPALGQLVPYGALVNTFAEIPPLALFPSRKYDQNWAQTGPYSMETWSYVQEPRYYVSAQRAFDLVQGTLVWTNPFAVCSGYGGSTHNRPVTNNEGDTFDVVQQGKKYAKVSPWHGYKATLYPATIGKNPSNHETNLNRAYRTYIDTTDSNVVFDYSQFGVPSTWLSSVKVTSSGDCATPFVFEDSRGTLLLTYVRPNGVVERRSDDSGRTWTDEVTWPANTKHGRVICSDLFTVLRMAYIAGQLVGTLQRAGDVSQSAFFTTKDNNSSPLAVEDDTFGIDYAKDNSGIVLGTFSILGENAVSDWVSADDGQTWIRL